MAGLADRATSDSNSDQARIRQQFSVTEFGLNDGTSGIKANAVTVNGSNVRFRFKKIRGTWEGRIRDDGRTLEGTWVQHGSVKLDLRKEGELRSWLGDTTPHTIRFVPVDRNIELEVVDWGGSGRPLVLVPGMALTAHYYDRFAQKMTATCHIYGITRRGAGFSSDPPPTIENFAADRLGDDVLTIIHYLNLNCPVLVGHSLGGEELSSVASRHPESVAGVIYLDAAYAYAFYDRFQRTPEAGFSPVGGLSDSNLPGNSCQPRRRRGAAPDHRPGNHCRDAGVFRHPRSRARIIRRTRGPGISTSRGGPGGRDGATSTIGQSRSIPRCESLHL